MKIAKKRRDKLFRTGKPVIRPAQYSDIRWMWAAAKRDGFKGDSTEFTEYVEPLLAQADKIFILEDRNNEFAKKAGPVGVVLTNYDNWSMVPHVEWFPWATPRNKLRCTVGFLQSMRYTQSVGSIKIFAIDEYADWFKWLRRYIPIILVGKIPGGRPDGNEWVFYVRGRRNVDRQIVRRRQGAEDAIRGTGAGVRTADLDHSPTSASNS